MAELTAAFVLGLVMGAFLALAWIPERVAVDDEPTEHGPFLR